MNDGWKFAEELLGITAEALKARREAEARAGVVARASQTPAMTVAAMEHVMRTGELPEVKLGTPDPGEDVGPNSARWAKIWAAEVAKRKGAEKAHAVGAAVMLAPMEVARRLWSMLRVENPQDPSLEAALSQMQAHIASGGFAGSTIALIENTVRDATLGEADAAILHARREDRRDHYPERREYVANFCGWTAGANAALDAIRALKSKPVPAHPAWCRHTPFHPGECEASKPATEHPLCFYSEFRKGTCTMSRGHDGEHFLNDDTSYRAPPATGVPEHPEPVHVSGKTTQVGQAPATDVCDAKWCSREKRHEGFCKLPPEPQTQPVVHDFGWALARMREGKKVRREKWDSSGAVHLKRTSPTDEWFAVSPHNGEWTARPEALDATDWQVVE